MDYDRFAIDPVDALIGGDEDGIPISVDSILERMDNPLWDFSGAVADRVIKIDILGLGGIDIEQY